LHTQAARNFAAPLMRIVEGHSRTATRTEQGQRMMGSHRQFRHPKQIGTITVAGKPGLEVHRGTLNHILEQAGLK
jgi:hypothetical protein